MRSVEGAEVARLQEGAAFPLGRERWVCRSVGGSPSPGGTTEDPSYGHGACRCDLEPHSLAPGLVLFPAG